MRSHRCVKPFVWLLFNLFFHPTRDPKALYAGVGSVSLYVRPPRALAPLGVVGVLFLSIVLFSLPVVLELLPRLAW